MIVKFKGESKEKSRPSTKEYAKLCSGFFEQSLQCIRRLLQIDSADVCNAMIRSDWNSTIALMKYVTMSEVAKMNDASMIYSEALLKISSFASSFSYSLFEEGII